MEYSLSKIIKEDEKTGALKAFKKMLPLLFQEKVGVIVSVILVIVNAVLNLLGPLVIGYAIDRHVSTGDYRGVLVYSAGLLGIYLLAFGSNYVQMRVMGAVAQRTLWRLRDRLFGKLLELPVSFFNQNKSGDLISRINRDTERLNEFFSQGLMRFAGNIFVVIGAGVFILFINWKLALASLLPGAGIFVFTRLMASVVGKRNARSASAAGLLSAEIQESITNFKVIIAFDRRDYFRSRFAKANEESFKASVGAGIVNELFTPVFEFAGNLAQLCVVGVGLYLVAQGSLALGLLVSFVLYVTRFYDPLREMARLWASLQTALAAWDRVSRVLSLSSDLVIVPDEGVKGRGLVEFRNVSFRYPDGSTVLHDASFTFEKGKTYALVGPTGGGKTTTASLIARLYDPTSGHVYLDGKDIRSYPAEERSRKIGFILQDPFLFSGTVADNLVYGSAGLAGLSRENLDALIKDSGLEPLLSRFDKGLDTVVSTASSLSLGQRQIVAFMRAILRKPDILILDEASANIDTVTEKLLTDALEKLPKETAKVVIAHRLNTIESADDIFFVNSGTIREAGSMEHALEMLLHHKRTS